jgi:hypothetical protein
MENLRMSLSNSLGAYRDCAAYFDRACADPKGIRLCGGTHAVCFSLRQRMHHFRNLDRRANAATYPDGHPMHNASAYDDYVLQIFRDDDDPPRWWLYISPRSAQILAIESLSEVGELIDVEGTEVHLIEDQSDAH